MYASSIRFVTPIALLILCCLATSLKAADADDALLQGAAERIDKHRKADVRISVIDDTGKPVSGVAVAVEQKRHAFLFGCNFFQFGRFQTSADEEAYRGQFADLFNYATLGFYWPSYENRKDQPNHQYAQAVAEWCQGHGITTKGHPLAWNYFEPRWLPDDLAEVKRLQLARISDCVTRFRGLIDIWDVVNEATHFERGELVKRAPKLTKMWQETGLVEFVDQCFKEARGANPEATLLINDYRVDPAYADLIKKMTEKAGERPYNVIGIQSHMHGGVWTNQKIWEVCERFTPFDVPLHFTELTVVSGAAGWERRKAGQTWDSTPEGEKSQADEVRRIYTMLFSHPSVTAITWWDFADRNAWQGAPAGLIGKDLQPKPAYKVLHDLAKNQWWTKLQLQTDAEGRAVFRGFLGEYVVAVTLGSGKVLSFPVIIAKDQPNNLQFTVK